jgi:hypothetical protein
VKLQIAHTAYTLVAYDYGYKKVPSIYSLQNWLKKIETSVRLLQVYFATATRGKKCDESDYIRPSSVPM